MTWNSVLPASGRMASFAVSLVQFRVNSTATARDSPWLLSYGGGGRQRGKANPPYQALETWVVPQVVHARIYMKIDKPVGMFFIAFLQIFNRAFVFSQADVDSGEKVGRDILLLR